MNYEKSNSKSKVPVINYFLTTGLGMCLGTWLDHGAHNVRHQYIPKYETVSQGYVSPMNLEIAAEDIDKSGNKALILRYDGKSYLMLDKEGKPQLAEYDVVPAKITYKP